MITTIGLENSEVFHTAKGFLKYHKDTSLLFTSPTLGSDR